MLGGWTNWDYQSSIPFGTRVWAWAAIAALPIIVSAFHGHKGLIPIATGIPFVIVLPWCHSATALRQGYANAGPNLFAHALVAGFAVFLCWWGVRLESRLLVNFGIVGFALAVAWFYFSDIMDKFGRSLGLIGLGVLFLAGGWALEKFRRKIVAGMGKDSGVSGVGGVSGVSAGDLR
jgi:hypothetical protein